MDEKDACTLLEAAERAQNWRPQLYIPSGYRELRPDPCPELTNMPEGGNIAGSNEENPAE